MNNVQAHTLKAVQDDYPLDKPRYLSKKQRQRLNAEKQELAVSREKSKPPKRKNIVQDVPLTECSMPVKRLKPQSVPFNKREFNFDWQLDEDTSVDYHPLVSLLDDSVDQAGLGSHWSEKPLHSMTARDWRIFREDYNITAKVGPDDSVHPLRFWNESDVIPPKIVDCLTKDFGYTQPTPIQRATIPYAASQRDIVGIAETGSGKTVAFLVPLLTYLLHIDRRYMTTEHALEANANKALGLILAPTRELALQISREVQRFCQKLNFNVITIIGGHLYEETIHALRNGVHIVVATPGRLIDSIEKGMIDLSCCHYLIMDEADKMIDMGFEKSLQSIMTSLPASTQHVPHMFNVSKRTTLMFTATMSPTIEKITKSYLTDPAYLYIGNVGQAIDNIDQRFEYLGQPASGDIASDLDKVRVSKVLTTIKAHVKANPRSYSIIVFANYKKVCEQLAQVLEQEGFKDSVIIHGSKTQEYRERAIDAFRKGAAKILIATDVAARGIDVPNVSLVINYQMSKRFDEYIHRIGRTGRAGNTGTSYTIIDDNDADVFGDLKKFLAKGRQRCPDWLLRHEATRVQILRE